MHTSVLALSLVHLLFADAQVVAPAAPPEAAAPVTPTPAPPPSAAPPAAPAAASPVPPPADAEIHLGPAKLTPIAYVEAAYSYNFNRPSNGITNYRGFDNRHDTLTLSNVALGTQWDVGDVTGRLILQVGHTPNTYYGAEPALAGASGASATDATTWKYLQEANIGWKAPVGSGLLVQAGLFVSPIGPEVLPVKDNWNWSRSNLFYGLPFYHTGARASYDVVPNLTATVALYNGWNSVTDNNRYKSYSASLGYKIPDRFQAQVLYFGGVERPTGAPEGPWFRHDFDAYAEVDPTSWLSFLAQGNAVGDPNRFGTSRWAAAALYARVKPLSWLYVAARGDRFYEHVGTGANGTASPIFWPVSWVSSGTLTLDARPVDHLSVRLEVRHDQADGDIFFRGSVQGDGGATTPFVPNAHTQDTLTLGATAWL